METLFLTEFAKFGVLGLIVLALGYVAWTQRGEIRETYELRIKEKGADTAVLVEALQQTHQSNAAVARAMEERNRSAEAMVKAVEGVSADLKSAVISSQYHRDAIAKALEELRGDARNMSQMLQSLDRMTDRGSRA